MEKFIVEVYKWDRFVKREEFPTMTQARKACKNFIATGYTSAGIFNTEKPGWKCIAKFGDPSVFD